MNPICTGLVSYNQRRFKLNQKTGKRIKVWKDESEVVSYRDESLRIISDEDFSRVQAKTASHKSLVGRPTGGGVIRPLTGLLYCPKCGKSLYARKSANAKGS
jgi:hypothetical protein